MSTTKSPYMLRVSSKDPMTMSVSELIQSTKNLLVASVLGARVQRALDHSAFDMAEDYHAAIPALIRALQAKGYDVTWVAYPRECAIAWLEHSPSKRMWSAMFDKDDSLQGRRTTGLPVASTSEDDIQVLESIAQDLAERSDSLACLAYLYEARALIVKLLRLKDETDGAVEYGNQPPIGGVSLAEDDQLAFSTASVFTHPVTPTLYRSVEGSNEEYSSYNEAMSAARSALSMHVVAVSVHYKTKGELALAIDAVPFGLPQARLDALVQRWHSGNKEAATGMNRLMFSALLQEGEDVSAVNLAAHLWYETGTRQLAASDSPQLQAVWAEDAPFLKTGLIDVKDIAYCVCYPDEPYIKLFSSRKKAEAAADAEQAEGNSCSLTIHVHLENTLNQTSFLTITGVPNGVKKKHVGSLVSTWQGVRLDKCNVSLSDLLYLAAIDGSVPDWVTDAFRDSAVDCKYEARRILETLCSRAEDLADAQAKSAP